MIRSPVSWCLFSSDGEVAVARIRQRAVGGARNSYFIGAPDRLLLRYVPGERAIPARSDGRRGRNRGGRRIVQNLDDHAGARIAGIGPRNQLGRASLP